MEHTGSQTWLGRSLRVDHIVAQAQLYLQPERLSAGRQQPLTPRGSAAFVPTRTTVKSCMHQDPGSARP